MAQHRLEHLIDYIVISTIIAVFMFSVVFFRFSHLTVKLVSTFSAAGYVIWGVVHHKKAGHIDQKILLEYLGIAALGLVIIFSLLN